MRRTPLPQRAKPLQRTASLRQVSRKRQREQRVYTKLRKAFLDLDDAGVMCAWPRCLNVADTVQHAKGRVGTRYLDTTTWLPGCLFHNLYAEDHPDEAKAVGFSASRLAS